MAILADWLQSWVKNSSKSRGIYSSLDSLSSQLTEKKNQEDLNMSVGERRRAFSSSVNNDLYLG